MRVEQGTKALASTTDRSESSSLSPATADTDLERVPMPERGSLLPASYFLQFLDVESKRVFALMGCSRNLSGVGGW